MLKFDKNKLVKNLAGGSVLAPFLDRAFETFDEPFSFEYTSKEHDDAWHPSGDCTPGVTALWEKATGQTAKWEPSGALRKSFMVGHYWHQLLQYIVVHKLEFATAEAIECTAGKIWEWNSLVTIKDLVTPKPYHWVRGSADVAPLVTPKWTGLVDFKTMSGQQFRQQTIPEWAADKYKCQMNIYLDLFDLDQALILAVNKDSPHEFKEFMYDRDQELIDAIYAKWEHVGHLIDNHEEPFEGDADTPSDDELFALPL